MENNAVASCYVWDVIIKPMTATLKIKDNPVALIIEDERPLLEAVKQKMELNGFDVITSRTAKQALGYLEDLKKVDVIWLDHYLLGRETGLDFVVKLKNPKSKWRKVPVFVVSNTASPEKVDAYLRLGVDKYYTKSDYRLDQMIKDIKTFIK